MFLKLLQGSVSDQGVGSSDHFLESATSSKIHDAIRSFTFLVAMWGQRYKHIVNPPNFINSKMIGRTDPVIIRISEGNTKFIRKKGRKSCRNMKKIVILHGLNKA